MSQLGEKLLTLHDSLKQADLEHAFGGAIALAYCTRNPRGTSDIDVNVFVHASNATNFIPALPPVIAVSDTQLQQMLCNGQTRLFWHETPIDIFLNTDPFHEYACQHTTKVPFEGAQIPVLNAEPLAVFKAMFNRPKDWVDLQDMVDARALNMGEVTAWLKRNLGERDPVVARFNALTISPPPPTSFSELRRARDDEDQSP